MLTEITSDNVLLAANHHANLGGMYRQSGKYELAKQYMEQEIHLLKQFGLVPYPQITNYALLLTEMEQTDMGLSALKRLKTNNLLKRDNRNERRTSLIFVLG